jgi:hypothetical protein
MWKRWILNTANLGIIEQPSKKVFCIGDRIVLAGTGEVGLGQRFRANIQTQHCNKLFSKERSEIDVGKTISASTRNDFASTGVQMGRFGALVGFALGDSFHLCEFGVQDFQPEFKNEYLWYCSMGSGQSIADPFLGFIWKTFWDGMQPTLDAAIFGVVWTLQQVIELNAGGVNGPMQIVTVGLRPNQKVEAKELTSDEILEHSNYVSEIEILIRNHRARAEGADSSRTIPELTS